MVTKKCFELDVEWHDSLAGRIGDVLLDELEHRGQIQNQEDYEVHRVHIDIVVNSPYSDVEIELIQNNDSM